ncbi:MAG: FGGY-family carbohydrate kinase [Paracoccaceae bacterium]
MTGLVIGIDASTTATKAVAWTAAGEAVAEGRAPVGLSSPLPNYYEQDPEEWWGSARAALRQVTSAVAADRIAAVSVANQRETIGYFRRDGRSVRPGTVWLDERARHSFRGFCDRLGADAEGRPLFHRITGKPVDFIPAVFRIAWMAEHEPGLHRETEVFSDVHGYLARRLTGRWATSRASADPLGLFDLAARRWSEPVMALAGIDASRLPEAEAPGTVLGEVTAAAAAETGLKAGTPVVAGGGDGQLAGLGCNALTPDTAYLNIGTALVSGIHGAAYLTSPAWRTMGSPTGEGYYYESCLRGGTFTVTWFLETICAGEPAPREALLRRLEAAAAGLPAGAQGLLMLPYWQGVMSPHWNPVARGAFVGLSGAHGQGHLYRAMLEGLALEQRLATEAAEARLGRKVERYVAIGGGAASALWRQIFADATGKRVERSDTVEASSLGAAICAAVGAGWFPAFADAARAMAGRIVEVAVPSPEGHAAYGEVLALFGQLYGRLEPLYEGLDRLAGRTA